MTLDLIGLPLVALLPFFGAGIVAYLASAHRLASAWGAGIITILALILLSQLAYIPLGGDTLVQSWVWIESIGLNFSFRLDGLGLLVKKLRGGALGRVSSGVVVTNYHQLKGLEFDHVVLFGLDDKTFPDLYLDKVLADDIKEEEQTLRKLLYVAMTRAKQTLTIVGGEPFCRFFNGVSNEWIIDI